MLSGSMAFLDFEWTDYTGGPCFVGREDPEDDGCDLTGDVNQQTPRWTASISGNFSFPVADDKMLSLTTDVNYKDEHFTSGDLDPRGLQEAVTKYNARLSFGAADDQWGVALVGKNLTDELTSGIGAATGLDVGGFRANSEQRRTVYLEAKFRY